MCVPNTSKIPCYSHTDCWYDTMIVMNHSALEMVRTVIKYLVMLMTQTTVSEL